MECIHTFFFSQKDIKNSIILCIILYKRKKTRYLQNRGRYPMAILWECCGYHMGRAGKEQVNGILQAGSWLFGRRRMLNITQYFIFLQKYLHI